MIENVSSVTLAEYHKKLKFCLLCLNDSHFRPCYAKLYYTAFASSIKCESTSLKDAFHFETQPK